MISPLAFQVERKPSAKKPKTAEEDFGIGSLEEDEPEEHCIFKPAVFLHFQNGADRSGDCLARSGRKAEAHKYYLRIIQEHPEDRYMCARAIVNLGDDRNEILTRLAKEYPEQLEPVEKYLSIGRRNELAKMILKMRIGF